MHPSHTTEMCPQVSCLGGFSFLLVFLQCVFSYVFSNAQHEMLHSYIDYIYVTFLHCVFSNDSSDRPFLTFLHCVFSNVSSNRLHKRMHNHTGYIFLTFLTSHKSHWLHLFDFSLLCVFKCFTKLLARKDANSHWLHLFDMLLNFGLK